MFKLFSLPQRLIVWGYYILFLVVPLILTPYNYELFEYNKMMTVYTLTVIITGSWLIKMIINRKIIIGRTPLDIPILLFFISQIISTVFSIDPHVSFWGYYSRFNGGLLSTISYILLYYAFVSNFPKDKINRLFFSIFLSGTIVSIWAVMEHFGHSFSCLVLTNQFDVSCWVQDVQNRVFATLGQPNWLAAYLAVLIPITLGLSFMSVSNQFFRTEDINQKSKIKNQNDKEKFIIGLLGYWVIGLLFYTTLLFTKSRSGFLGFWISLLIFSLLLTYYSFQIHARANFWKVLKPGLFFISLFLIITFFLGAPFPQINRFTLPELINRQQTTVNRQQKIIPTGDSIIDVGITESGKIREIVWKGAIDIFKNNPLIGTGVETFAFSYYKYRPVEHNMTSEWDFLYNKAHNEYLNYAANSGSFGLGSYLLIILFFIGWNLNQFKNQNSKVSKQFALQIFGAGKITVQNSKLSINDLQNNFALCTLHSALFTAFISIIITNFFGFSVVLVQLFFFLIPAISFVLIENAKPTDFDISSRNFTMKQFNNVTINNKQKIMSLILFFVICYMLYVLSRYWYADMTFAAGYQTSRNSDYLSAYKSIKEAIRYNDREPLYYDEFSYPSAELAVAVFDEKQSTLSAKLTQEAILASNIALDISPNNVNFWKTRTRVFYTLSQLDDKYISDALSSLEKSETLSPTDPKIHYNLGLLYDKIGMRKEAIMQLMKTTALKPDYRDTYIALALLYEKDKQKDKAKEALKFILTKIATDDAEAKKKLDELK